MGLTPLDGVIMGTRSGDIDPCVFTYQDEQDRAERHRADRTLNTKSGLLGYPVRATTCGSCRTKPRAATSGPGSPWTSSCTGWPRRSPGWSPAWTGCDALVFTGGIGENSAIVRGQVLAPPRLPRPGRGPGGQRRPRPVHRRPDQPSRPRPGTRGAHRRGTHDRPRHRPPHRRPPRPLGSPPAPLLGSPPRPAPAPAPVAPRPALDPGPGSPPPGSRPAPAVGSRPSS